ncbi:MAG: LCP family protein [Firmicutes bacterium]|nr:LCP family protein [Bacillota bacterium]
MRNKRMWQRAGMSALCIVLALVLISMIFVTAYAKHYLDVLAGGDEHNYTLSSDDWATATETADPDFTGPSLDHTDVTVDTMPTIPERHDSSEMVNIMLIGEDRRPGESRQRSDSMILCSFNLKTNTLTMISFLRDTYVILPGIGGNKLNAAYQYGGPAKLAETLAVNFGVHVDASVMVDFDGFRKVIDLLGGVDINLTEREVRYLSGGGFADIGVRFDDLVVGMNHLDGEKALAYSRIRKLDMDAYRAQRQRTVLTALINAYKSKDIGTMFSVATQILDAKLVTTDMTSQEIIGYIGQLFPLLSTITIQNQQIPAAGSYTEATVGSYPDCKVADMELNRDILKKILWNE